ncbi:MAG TPA: hypothetical protein VE378_05065 [Nitrososphaeraceae archaeon]|nr:hypothetical protein [Nitrososphaeraceae archaeon]
MYIPKSELNSTSEMYTSSFPSLIAQRLTVAFSEGEYYELSKLHINLNIWLVDK